MTWLEKLFGKGAAAPTPAGGAPVGDRPAGKPYLTQTVVFGMHRYRRADEDSSVYFVDESRGIRRQLVDRMGRIRHFPGVCREDFWAEELAPNALQPQIRFRTSFEERGERWLMLWEVQPDGRYWGDDDGFGMEHEAEITLYTYVDGRGQFTGPFRLYSIGSRCYSLDRFEHVQERWYPLALDMAKDGALRGDRLQHPADILFPRMGGMGLSAGARSLWEHTVLWSASDARDYWAHPVLGPRLAEAAGVLLTWEGPITQRVDYPYHKSIHSSMTLFHLATGEPVFKEVLDRFYEGKYEPFTEKMLKREAAR